MNIKQSRYYKNHIKPMIKDILYISITLSIILIVCILLVNNIKDQFEVCDSETGHTCSIYELHHR